jgi:hypothetical protein
MRNKVHEGTKSLTQEWKGKYTVPENYINKFEMDEPQALKVAV